MTKKHIVSALTLSTILLIAVTAAGCGGKSKSITVDPAALASSIAQSAVSSDTLTETAQAMLPAIYYISEDVLNSGCAYMSAGSTACEVAVIECKEAKQTADVKKLFEERVKSQSDLYASYNQGEVAKLDRAIIKTAGKYAVLAVCDDNEKAEALLTEAGF